MDPNYFDPQIRHAAHFIKTYLDTYKNIPTPDQVSAETGITINLRSLSKHEVDFATTELEQFCKHSAIERAVMASPKLLVAGDYGKIEMMIKEAITTGLSKNLGLDYFYEPAERLNRMLLNNKMISTKLTELDIALNGGLMRKEMTLFAANSGVGKSIQQARWSTAGNIGE